MTIFQQHKMRFQRVLAFAVATSLVPALFSSSVTGQDAPNRSRPNIVLILADDLGYGDIAAFNPRSRIPTPHVDRLAREGVRFIDAHTNSAVCTPTRYGLLTGRYAWRTSLQRGVLWGEGDPLIESGRLTLASMLKAQGYTTGVVGKWHLGLGWAARPGAVPSTRTRNQIGWIGEAASHGHDASGGWRGVKAGLYEGGHRVPFVVRWPGMIPAGATSSRLVATTDIVATIADLVGATLPSNAAEDSVSFASNLKNPARDAARTGPLVLHSQNGSFAIRSGDWKLILSHAAGTDSDPSADVASPAVQLYDLGRDPAEKTNLATERADVVRRLESALEQLRSKETARAVRQGRPPTK